MKARTDVLAPLLALARKNHPERYAPNGEALCNYDGHGWAERLESWRRAHAPAPPDNDEAKP